MINFNDDFNLKSVNPLIINNNEKEEVVLRTFISYYIPIQF